MKRAIIIEIIAFLFVLLFLYAAMNKLMDYQKFTVQIGQSPLLTGFGGSIPWMVISIEVLISVLLIVPRFRLIGFFAAFSLMTMFTTYIWAILNFGKNIPCSCGGILEKLGWQEHLVFNSVFVVLGIVGIVLLAQETKAVKTTTNITEPQNSLA